MPKKRKLSPEEKEKFRELIKELPGIQPLFFKRPDSEKLFGVPSRVLEDLAMKKKGPAYYRRGKYCVYSVPVFVEWLTENPIRTTGSKDD
jgi:hypothetical protein